MLTTRGLLIAGIGRSGTSIASRSASWLGLRLPKRSDLIPGNSANPGGYWESSSLTEFNDGLLARWEGSWWRPPLSVTDVMLQGLTDLREQAADVFLEAFGDDDGWVWKDPRLTVLLPFWLSVLGDQPILFPYRDPQSVARSIMARDGLSYEQGLAIWEIHMRLALGAMQGHRVLFASFERLRNDSFGWEAQLQAFCRDSGLVVGNAEPLPVDWIARPRSSGQGPISPEQRALFEFVQARDGANDRFVFTGAPPESKRLRADLESVTVPGWAD